MADKMESLTRTKVKNYINKLPNSWVDVNHGSLFETRGRADLTGSLYGRPCAIEIKCAGVNYWSRDGFKAQLNYLNARKKNGWVAFVATSVDDFKRNFDLWMSGIDKLDKYGRISKDERSV